MDPIDIITLNFGKKKESFVNPLTNSIIRGALDMDQIKDKISSFGAFLSFAGVASAALSFFNYNLKILMWIDNWGTATGWGIRAGLLVVGMLFYFLGKMGKNSVAA